MLIKAFRLFVSSTFTDFAQEREILQSKVFPALDAYCSTKGYQFHAVDLRWGVNEEAQLDQRTAEICLGEVAAAKGYPPPNFLIMVGDRYGWVPLPFAIAEDEFEAATAWLAERGRAEAVRDLRKVYRLDENYLVPPGVVAAAGSGEPIGAYTLRSREDEIPELTSVDAWSQLEGELRGALQEAIHHLAREGRISETARAKYVLSLTEQEIIHGLPGYDSVAGNGAQSASVEPGAGGPQSIAWIREEAGDDRAPERRPSLLRRILGLGRPADADLAAERDPRVETLKAGIRRALPADCVLSGRASKNGRGELDAAHLEDFAARLEGRLKAAIDKHIVVIEAQERSADAELLQERAQHEAFAWERAGVTLGTWRPSGAGLALQLGRSVFFGRDGNRAAIASYLAGDEPHPLVLFGPSGLGKSALMARAVADAEERSRGAPVVYRFVGASAASADARSLLVSIVEDLAAHGITVKPDQWEDDANKFDEQTRTLLLSIEIPGAIFIDALDQLKKPYRLSWLPDKLPPNLKIVVSVLNDAAYEADSGAYRTLRQRLPSEAFLEIEPLTGTQGRDILMALEESTHKRLRPGQRDYVLTRLEQAGASPLYLKVAFEIARAWRSWDEAGQGRYLLAGDTPALVGQLIAGLTSVHHHEPELVSRTLGYLAAAKNGLSVKEITDVLSGDRDVMKAISSERHGVRTGKLPDSVWVRLHRQLAPLLVEKRVDEQPLLQFFHRQLADIAREQHYALAKAALHGALADYFDAGTGTASKDAVASGTKTYARRSLSELPYQLFHADRRTRLDQILTAPDWMQQKLNAFGSQILIADYDQFATSDMQRLIDRTLRLITSICARDPRQLLPQLIGRLMTYRDLAAPRFLDEARRHLMLPALLAQHPSLTPAGAEIARLEGHTGAIRALVVLPDDRLASGSRDRTIRLWDPRNGAEIARLEAHPGPVSALTVLPDGRLASASSDNTIRLWNLRSGRETARLEGHTGPVEALAVLPDGRLVSASSDNTIRLWDPRSGAETARLEGHTGPVEELAVLSDGRLASASSDNTIRLWDPRSGGETARLEGHRGWVNALTVLPDGRLASGHRDTTIRLWDPRSGAETARLEGHTGPVNALTVLPDGRLVSGSLDTTIRLWDTRSGAAIALLEGHTGWVNSLAALPDGRLASGARESTIRLWDPTRAGETTRLLGQSGAVRALMVLPDDRVVSGCSSDSAIRLWDPTSGAETARLEGHTDQVWALAVLPDGRLASGSRDHTIRLWDLRSGAETARLEGHTDSVAALVLLPDTRLASGSHDDTIRLWDLKSGAETARLEGHIPDLASWDGTSPLTSPILGAVRALTMLPDGRLGSASQDHTIRLWDPRSGAETARLEGHTGPIEALAMLPDGRLASASSDNTIRLWDPRSGAEIGRLEGHTDQVWALAVLPDGRLASGSRDHTIRLWDPKTGTESARLDVDTFVSRLATFPHGRLVAGDEFGRLHWLEIVD